MELPILIVDVVHVVYCVIVVLGGEVRCEEGML
jgi:hypothetical protein